MAGEALTDGIQVNDGHAQIGDVIQLFHYTLEIAAVKIIVQHQTVLVGPPVHLFIPVQVNGVGLQLTGEVALSGLVEAIGEDLIDQRTLCPVRGGKISGDTADLPAVAGLHIGIVAVFEQLEIAATVVDSEEIEEQAALGERKFAGENVVGAVLFPVIHGYDLGQGAMLVINDALDLGGLDRGGDVNVQCTDLIRHQGAKGVFVLSLLAVKQNTHNDLLVNG